MRKIYLPQLLSIDINDFSLYSAQPTFKYDFVNGVNLIIGVNGIGKTTFTSLIKYGLIGAYKKDVDVRVYMNEKKENRIQFGNDFFRNRMNTDFQNNENASIMLKFKIADTFFYVKRSIYNLIIENVTLENSITNEKYDLSGIKMRQDAYERLNESNERKTNSIQFQYEKIVAEKSNFHSFDDFIFFVNEILFFGENRKTVLWDAGIQERLSNKYFNDISLDEKFEIAKRDAKYYDSLSRHKSEDIRAIKTMIKKIKLREEKNIDKIQKYDFAQEVIDLKSTIERLENKLNSIQRERLALSDKNKNLNFNRQSLYIKIKELETKEKSLESSAYKKMWEKFYPNYQILFENVKINHLCPMCNNQLNDIRLNKILSEPNKCFFCGETLYENENNNESLIGIKEEIKNLYKQCQGLEHEIVKTEKDLEQLDNIYNNMSNEILKHKVDYRTIEHNLTTESNNFENDLTYSKMVLEINDLEKEKISFQKRSEENRALCQEIIQNIDELRRKTNKELSEMFSKYAEYFLGMPAFLTYDKTIDNQKTYLPVINGTIRRSPEELSESQRFFVDHSFRMSLLNYFYNSVGLFICETPESSLDISYEANAADTFLKFLEMPNVLIITTNLNNSHFLTQIIEKASKISYLNLLDYGNPSMIQRTNISLLNLSKEVEAKINAK
jgi:hypothetical protein